MTRRKITFTKELVSVNQFYNFKNTVKYNILGENSATSTLTIYSTLTAHLQTEDRKYHIKPVTFAKFFVKGLEIFSGQEKIGSGDSLTISISTAEIREAWKFHVNTRWFGRRRSNPYNTKFKCGDKEIDYEIQLGDYFSANNKHECLRNVNGTAFFNQEDQLACYFGIYLNELLIFNDMDK